MARRWRGLRNKNLKNKKQRLFLKQNGQCKYCEQPFALHELTIDHVLRRRDGGSNKIDNLVLACSPCNQRRA